MNDPLSKRRVSQQEMRRRFNSGPFPEQITRGELTEKVLKSTPLSNPKAKGEPPGTLSQYVRYLNKKGKVVVEGHRYLRPDGTLGASGKFDPKLLVYKGFLYLLKKKKR